MNKIAQIREMLAFLPEKDIKLANNLLDARHFVELKELVDSDVYKLDKKKLNLMSKLGTELETPEIVQEYYEVEEKFNKLRELQSEVNFQASAFESDLSDEEFFEPNDYD